MAGFVRRIALTSAMIIFLAEQLLMVSRSATFAQPLPTLAPGLFLNKDRPPLTTDTSFRIPPANRTAVIEKMTIHDGLLYVGAVNHLYQLDADSLDLEHVVQTGPELDNPMCSARGDCMEAVGKNSTKVPTDNHNKVLLVYPERKRLITCGTLFQGVCQLRLLTNIEKATSPAEYPVSVSSNALNASTVAFIGTGPEGARGEPVMYVGVTFTQEYYRDHIPAMSTRSLSEATVFSLYQEMSISAQSGLLVQMPYREKFRIHFVHGFESEGYAYWAVVQPTNIGPDVTYVTKLGRICVSDDSYRSYSEISLGCHDDNMNGFRYLQTAYVGPLGRDSLGATGDDNPGKLFDDDNSFQHAFRHSSTAKSSSFGDKEFFVGVFAKGDNPSKPSAPSGICVFAMDQIREQFSASAARCNEGIGHENLIQYGANNKCTRMASPHAEHCNMRQVGGEIGVVNTAVLRYPDALLTSLTVDAVENHTVLFAGTSEGYLKKIVVRASASAPSVAVEYDEESLSPGDPIGKDLLMDAGRKHLFVNTAKRIFKIPVERCARHLDCGSCLLSRDPYCGWCSLENRCSPSAQCSAADVRHRWIPTGEGSQCPHIVTMRPSNASLNEPGESEVFIGLNFLPVPESNSNYQCVFGNIFVLAQFSEPATLRCPLPPFASRPRIPSGQDHVVVPLKIWSSGTEHVYFQGQFTFFDCTSQSLCTACLQTRWPCNWCLGSNHCVHDRDACSLGPGQDGQPAQTTKKLSVDRCPHIQKGGDRMVANNHLTPIQLSTANLDKIMDPGSKLECQVNIEDSSVKLPASLTGVDRTVVECQKYRYGYEADTKTQRMELSLVVDESLTVDRINVTLYKCELLAVDCSTCRTFQATRGCRWCMGACRYSESCPGYSGQLDSGCPDPVIKSIYPLSGPREGGTFVTIVGQDLGISQSDVDGRVYVGGVPCKVIQYEVSRKIVCVTNASAASQHPDDHVTVMVKRSGQSGTEQKRAQSNEQFLYVDPSIFKFEPKLGPMSGGTKVKVFGNHLDAASNITLSLGGYPCELDHRTVSDRELVCVTSPATRSGLTVDFMTVHMDNAVRRLSSKYTYLPDPKVTAVQPTETFQSGGRRLIISGVGFSAIQQPQVFFLSSTKEQFGPETCLRENDTFLICPTPPIPAGSLRKLRRNRNLGQTQQQSARVHSGGHYEIDDGSSLELETSGSGGPDDVSKGGRRRQMDMDLSVYESLGVGFVMDGVKEVLDLSRKFRIAITPDPEYFQFENGEKQQRGDPLIIEGRNLNLACTVEDVSVMIGEEKCNVTLLSLAQLVCMPPVRRPRSVDASGRMLSPEFEPVVTVHVGNLEFPLGTLVYNWSDDAQLSASLVGGVVATGTILLLVFVAVFAVWWRRKSCQAEKEYKRIQMQMDTLESNVRNECKQAFAELQTDMSDLNSDLVALGIPCHRRKVYAAKIMFKDDHALAVDWQHPISNGYTNGFNTALSHFDSLLANRAFLLPLLAVLDHQPTFTAKDRVCVASLLTATLARNMQYFTEIVIILLKDLIRRSVDGKHPQLMLRRTESVVEKMLANWIALCLYDYLQDVAGERLFFLYKALKHQIEKGPVDAVYGDARYSLSEDKLLKEQIQPCSILLFPIPPDQTEPEDKLSCRVLRCDTVSQAKAKLLDTIYRKVPFSARPTVADIDLEWRAVDGHYILTDDDRTSPQSKDGWRRINTMDHYGLPPKAIVALLPKNKSSFTYSVSACSTHTYASIGSSSSLLLSHSPENLEQGIRYWHFVKMEEQSNGSRMCAAERAASPARSIPEIYLTRLLATKGTVQSFIDDFFTTALNAKTSFPIAVKYLFDLMESEAVENGVADMSIVHAWKNNSLPLRFWVNVIKNPDFVFDVEKTTTLDSSLSVIAQTFMDACSMAEAKLGKDSPSNKLLFARDMPRYRDMVAKFYLDIRHQSPVSDQELAQYMSKLSKDYENEFNTLGAVRELLSYVIKYSDPIMDALSTDPHSVQLHLHDKLGHILSVITKQTLPTCR